jgi:hypothetical protein
LARKDCERIQEDTERDYSKTECGKNVLVFDDGGDGEKYPAILFKAMDDRLDLRDGEKDSGTIGRGTMAAPSSMESGFRGYRARLQSERIWEERSGV